MGSCFSGSSEAASLTVARMRRDRGMNDMRRAGLMLCLLAMLWAAAASAEVYIDQKTPVDWEERALLRITILETGRSDAMLLECGGETMMIDGGDDSYRLALRHDMEARDIAAFKYLLNTHPDNDHIDGLRRLMEYGFEVGTFLSPFPVDMDYTYQQQAVKTAVSHGVPWQMIFDGDVLTLGEARLEIRCCYAVHGRNAHSAVVRVCLGKARMLLCADINGLTQRWFLADDPTWLEADIVKAPHHGITAMVPEFLSEAGPALICVTNTHERGQAAVLQAEGRHIPWLCSGDGEIVLETDGVDWYVTQHAKQGKNR